MSSAPTRYEPLLRAEEEVELAKTIEVGLYAQHLLDAGSWTAAATAEELTQIAQAGKAAFDRFVAANIALAKWQANFHTSRATATSLSFEDLEAEAILAVIHAVQKFDYTYGVKFSGYATRWIRQRLTRAILAAAPLAMVGKAEEHTAQLFAARAALTDELGRSPRPAELAAHLGMPITAVTDLLRALTPTVSIDAPIPSTDDLTIADLLAQRPADTTEHDASIEITGLLDELSSRERDLITTLFGLADASPRTVHQIALERGISAAIVARTAESALDKMRASARRQLRAA